jgi:hypothetical protein
MVLFENSLVKLVLYLPPWTAKLTIAFFSAVETPLRMFHALNSIFWVFAPC